MESRRRERVARLVAAMIVLVVGAGCGLTGGRDEPTRAAANQPTTVGANQPTTVGADEPPTVEPRPDESTTAPTTRPTRKPARKAAPTAKPTRSAPTADPNWDQAPDCATYPGVRVSRTKVKAALQAAAARQYWRTEAPTLRVSYQLVKAIAWQESGWQSNIVNCDGGTGLMQTMPDTVAHMNQRFGLAYDASDYRDNAFVGANYLAWLTRKFGEKYFKGRYDLSPARCRSHADPCLLNMVIAGYNAGFGDVEESVARHELPRPRYVDNVRSLMISCYCDRF